MLHAAITLFFAVAGWLCHIPVLAWLCAAFYTGREHAQAEYRWIDAYGNGTFVKAAEKQDTVPVRAVFKLLFFSLSRHRSHLADDNL